MNNKALGIIDAQRGFMPAEEGQRLQQAGFGELPVAGGHEVVAPSNTLLHAFMDNRLPTFTTQDWHPTKTAHFAEEPNFTTTWPKHCVEFTNGAKLHPELEVAAHTLGFIKGSEVLQNGEDDTSYSGFFAEATTVDKIALPHWLRDRNVQEVVLGGLALDYCVGKTALDLRTKLGIDVTVALDATRGIAEESQAAMLEELGAAGVHIANVADVLETLKRERN